MGDVIQLSILGKNKTAMTVRWTHLYLLLPGAWNTLISSPSRKGAMQSSVIELTLFIVESKRGN